ncbi:hypothetical protein MBLNU459_g6916t3 [Dothideomycetes sp. NU459]
MALLQSLRDNLLYNYGYFQGKSYSLTGSFSNVYGLLISKVSSFVSLPLPLMSFLALPFFGSTSTSINLIFFYLTWSALVLSHDPLHVEIYGTMAIRLMFYLLPALGFLAFDAAIPSLSASIKAAGDNHLAHRLGRRKLTKVVTVAVFNTFLAIGVQAGIEFLLTEVLHFRSGLRVSTTVPLPWSIGKDVLRAIVVRGFLHYAIHRYVLHASPCQSPLARWHRDWAHSIRYPFALAAAYDHPINYLLAHWVPLYLPAMFFRFHVLTWHIVVALVSLEQLFIYSGYAVLPSKILLAGMARRTDTHYAQRGEGNFGHWGILDWMFGTSCAGEADVMDDVRDEAESRDVRRRVSDAKDGAKGLAGDAKKRFGFRRDDEKLEDVEEDEEPQQDGSPTQGGKRRSKRRAKKA